MTSQLGAAQFGNLQLGDVDGTPPPPPAEFNAWAQQTIIPTLPKVEVIGY